MSDVIRLCPPPARDDGFDELHGRMYAEIDTLRVVTELLRHRDFADDTLLSARSVLIDSLKRLDDVHTEFERWDMRRRRRHPEP